MSQETSPGMRALEAMDFYVFHHGLRLAGLPKDRDTARKEIAAIIERATACDRLHIEELDSSDACKRKFIELQAQADELAKALERIIELDDRKYLHRDLLDTQGEFNHARAALAAYRKDNHG